VVVTCPKDVRRAGDPVEKGDPEYGLKGLLSRNLENLPPEKFSEVVEILDADGHRQQVLLAWIAYWRLLVRPS
jgi:hypothetical protein